MTDVAIDLDAFRRRSVFDGPAPPTLDTLARLIDRHAASIPLENIDVLTGGAEVSLSASPERFAAFLVVDAKLWVQLVKTAKV